MSIKINVFSHFASVSGEQGKFAPGELVVFLRLAGCNLKCSWCDTRYSHNAAHGSAIDANDLAAALELYSVRRLVITGGEPLLQLPGITALLKLLPHWDVAIETNGSINPSPLLVGDYAPPFFVMDYKMPGSNAMGEMVRLGEIAALPVSHTMIKIVCGDARDLGMAEFVINSINTRDRAAHPGEVAPLHQFAMGVVAGSHLTNNQVIALIKEQGWTNVRLNYQLHKVLSLSEEK